MVEWIKKWLEKLAKSNEESFGAGGPSCCGVNRRPAARHPDGAARAARIVLNTQINQNRKGVDGNDDK